MTEGTLSPSVYYEKVFVHTKREPGWKQNKREKVASSDSSSTFMTSSTADNINTNTNTDTQPFVSVYSELALCLMGQMKAAESK